MHVNLLDSALEALLMLKCFRPFKRCTFQFFIISVWLSTDGFRQKKAFPLKRCPSFSERLIPVCCSKPSNFLKMGQDLHSESDFISYLHCKLMIENPNRIMHHVRRSEVPSPTLYNSYKHFSS